MTPIIGQITNTYDKSLTLYVLILWLFFIITASNLLNIDFIIFFSIYDMIVLIVSHRSAFLLYRLPLSYHFIFTIYDRFSIRFSSGLNESLSIIFSPVDLLCSKNSWVSLDTWEGALSCIDTHFTLKLRDGDLYHAKKVFSLKSQ